MAGLDWIVVVVVLGSMVLGGWRGLVFEVMSVAGWVAALVLAQLWALEAARRLPIMGSAAEPIRYAAGFVVVFVAVVFAGGLVAWLVKKLVEALGLRPADRTLGAAFGLVRGAVLLLAATVVVSMTPLKDSVYWRESVSAGWLTAALKGLKPALPASFGRYLP